MEYQQVLKRVGEFGPFQKRLVAMLFFAGIPNAFPNIMFAYTQYEPNYHCAIPREENFSKNSTEYQSLLNQSFVWEKDSLGVKKLSRCKMRDIEFKNESIESSGFGVNSEEISQCKYGIEYENMDTVTAEFGLVCESSWMAAFAVTLYMCGMGLGAFSGFMSDRFGRRPVFLIFTFGQFALTAVTASTWDFPSYAISVLAVGLFGLVNYVVAYVLATEVMGVKRQLSVGIICCMAYSLGYTISPLMGYFFPNWRWYLRVNAILGLFYLPLIKYFPESPRWLLVGKKEKEAKKILARMARENGRVVDVDDIYQTFQMSYEASEENKLSLLNEKKIDIASESSYWNALKNSTMRNRFLVLCLLWFVASLVYFAISLNPSHLSGDRLLNIFLTGFVEFPGLAISYYLPKKIGRVRPVFILCTISGISCTVAPFLRTVSPVMVKVVVLTGKCAVGALFNLGYLMASEISPTLIRTTSLGIASTCARVAGIIMPYLMFAGGENDTLIPYLVMGILCLTTGVLYIIIMPETKGIPMPDSVEVAVKNKRLYRSDICKTFPDENNELEQEKISLQEKEPMTDIDIEE